MQRYSSQVMPISMDELRQIADLARLRLSDVELEAMHSDLNRVLTHFTHLQELQLAGVEVSAHAVDAKSVWDNDEPSGGLTRDQALSSAPSAESGLFLVPTIIE